ncbi:MAG: hypothetical protein ABIQ06_10615 [Caldimonas sp.]
MLSINALGMVMSVASGIVKLAGRLDLLMAEKEGVQGPLFVPMPAMTFSDISVQSQKERLATHLAQTAGQLPDALGTDRAALAAALQGNQPTDILSFFQKIFPDEAVVTVVDPDGDFIKALKLRLPGLDFGNEDTRLAAFCLSAGQDERGLGYVTRTALLVADVVAEFGVEHAAQFISHQPTRDLVASIVGRFAKPDLESFTEWGPLLRHGLASALEGLVENKAAIEGSTPWLGAVLGALAAARDDPAGGTDFITGLVNGKGYALLFSKGLMVAADRLAPEGATPFQAIAADVLRGAAPLVKKASGSGFRTFFNDNWGELLRAGLVAVDKHGPALLSDQQPLLRDVTLALVKELSVQPDLTQLSRDVVFHLADVAIGVVAQDPTRLTSGGAQPWLKAFVTKAIEVVHLQGVRETLGREGIEQVLLQGLGVLGEHPELIDDDGGLRVQWIGTVLTAVSQAGALDGKTLATATVTGVLERLSRQPNLVGTRYPEIVAALAGELAAQVKARGLTGVQAAQALHAAADALLRNPALFEKLDGQVAPAVMRAVLAAAGSDKTGLVSGATLVQVLGSVLNTFARSGQPLLALAGTAGDAAALEAQLTALLNAVLGRAVAELGQRLDGGDLPRLLAGLVAAVARGNIAAFDPKSPEFPAAFETLFDAAVA